MPALFNIQYLTRQQIHLEKWDECVRNAGNGLIYAHSAFLNLMTDDWDALILNDYEAVMPLPYRRKFGIYYLYQPFLTPVLGIFGKHISDDLTHAFLLAIPGKFRLWDISLNHGNNPRKKFSTQIERSNFILPLQTGSYEYLRSRYSESVDRNITRAIRNGCVRKKNIPLDEIIRICQQEWPAFTKISNKSFDKIARLSELFTGSQTYGVYHPGGRLLSGCFFLNDGKRAYYWLVGNDPMAKELGASPFLIDHFIRDYAGQQLILDFEGSDVKGIAEFYRRFGSIAEPYTTIYHNRLPFPLNLFKKLPAQYESIEGTNRIS